MSKDIMRQEYRPLTDLEKQRMARVKELGRELYDYLASIAGTREISIAQRKTEEAVMWAVKHITG